ncbi:cytochrome P450 [Tomitella biformata]|uniref:cytochrome P450 n=1 Tax=Tomitella biformata TaxID=630403 RepID=UPI0004673DCA|nr:cytochrome P450 [Tomitella biformata]
MPQTSIDPSRADTPLLFNPYDYGFHDDPYPTYKRLRAEAPAYHNPELGFWALSRHADVLAGFRDKEGLSSANGVSLDPAAYGPHAHKTMSFLAMDDPRHIRMRSLVSRGFNPRRIMSMQARILELTHEHLDPALAAGEFDFIADFAGKLPMDVISELMGVPPADRAEIRRLADLVVHREDEVLDVPVASIEAALHLIQYYSDMLKLRRANPGEDLTSALVDAEIDGDRLTDEEIIGFMFLMVVAGNETTTKLLGNAMFWGHHHPDQLAKPMKDPGRVSDWVEETLRFDTSSQMVARTSTRELAYGDIVIPPGEKVLLLVGSANRDERVFANPETYDIGREGMENLASFGLGTHYCLGAHLARLEANIVLAEFVKAVRSFEIDEAASERVHSTNVRGFATMPMRVQVR